MQMKKNIASIVFTHKHKFVFYKESISETVLIARAANVEIAAATMRELRNMTGCN